MNFFHFFSFFLSKTPPLRAITIPRVEIKRDSTWYRYCFPTVHCQWLSGLLWNPPCDDPIVSLWCDTKNYACTDQEGFWGRVNPQELGCADAW